MNQVNRSWTLLKATLLFWLSISLAFGELPQWSYDPGPNLKTKMGKELIDLNAEIPNFPEISKRVLGEQKFRPAFGPVAWRMRLSPNSVKILFIGQDATHIAEAAGRTATAGFGGRAQDLARYFGVNESAAFINSYAFTIRGQYGGFDTPYVYKKNGEYEPRMGHFVDNKLWAISQDQDSPIVQWRNDLIDWIIRQNKKSLKLIVLFGGAARDSIATFIESRGGDVEAKFEEEMDRIQIPETKLVHAGGNNEFPVLINQDEEDLYGVVLEEELDYESLQDQKTVQFSWQKDFSKYFEHLIFTKGGPRKNGLLHPAQLGGFDLNKITINGKNTISLKGLKLNDGKKIRSDILVVTLPHPSSLSRDSKDVVSQKVARSLLALDPYVAAGWSITADPGEENKFALDLPYEYSRADIGPEFYDFGTPGTRMVPVSTASRMGKHVIVFGTREKAKFDHRLLKKITESLPAQEFSEAEMFIGKPRTIPERYIFDPGPGEKYAKLIKMNLDLKKIFTPKKKRDPDSGKRVSMNFENDGISAYNVKNHPEVADFGHYRGTFKTPSVLILADPDGYDDLITSRALTGERGQYLHGLMEDIGVDDQYLVIKTVPFAMDGANLKEWKTVLAQTKVYREKLIRSLLKDHEYSLILTDGPYAQAEIKRILGQNRHSPVVHIKRDPKDKSFGIVEAGEEIAQLEEYEGVSISGKLANIPRSHLTYYARLWEGTSGDRVITSQDKYKGLAFAEVAPRWA